MIDHENVYQKELQISSRNPEDLNFSHILHNHNRQVANSFQYTNYYHNFPVNDVTRTDLTPHYRASNQFPEQCNLQNERRAMFQQETKPQHSQQRFLMTNINPVIMDSNFGYFAETLSNQIPSCEARKVRGPTNEFFGNVKCFSNYHVLNNSQNAIDVPRYSNQINYESFLNPVSNIDNRYDSNLKPLTYPKDDVFMENKQEFGGNFQDDGKCYMRPILKGASANIKVNYC